MHKKIILFITLTTIIFLTTGCNSRPLQTYNPTTTFIVKVNALQGKGAIGNWTDDDLIINGNTYSVSAWKPTVLDVVTHTGELVFVRGSHKQKLKVKKGDTVDVIIEDFNLNVTRHKN